MKLTFLEESHTYFVDGKRVPGVSDILKQVGLQKEYFGTDTFYRDRGIATHAAIKLILEGKLDQSSVDPVCQPYIDGAMRFLDTLKTPIQAVEQQLYSSRLNFAGTLDLVAGDTLYDWKCSKSPDPASELQGAAYSLLWGENYGLEIPFRVIKLPGDGTFKIIDYKTESPNLWDAVMEIWRWKTRGKR